MQKALEANDKTEQAYLKMPNWQYYLLTILLYVMCVLGSIYVTNVATIFDILGAFTITDWMLPGLCYLLLNKENSQETPM